MPNPKPSETEEQFITRFMASEEAKKDFPDGNQRFAVAKSKFNQTQEKEFSTRVCLKGLKVKEEEDSIVVSGLVATTHPDRVGDILSENAIGEIVNYINNVDSAGGDNGAYRSVSLFHDWIHEADPTLDEAAFLKPTARKIELEDGHFGVEVDAEINKYYKGDMAVDEIKYRIDNHQIAGFSIEYDTDDNHTRDVEYGDKTYRFIDGLTEFGGVGLARARMIANPHAVIYKEIVNKLENKEDVTMAEEEKVVQEEVVVAEPAAESTEEVAVEEVEEKVAAEPEVKEVPKPELDIKEIVAQVKEAALKELEVKNKVVKTNKEEQNKMEAKEISLSVKEMKAAVSGGKVDLFKFKEGISQYFAERPGYDAELKEQYQGTGIVLRPTLQSKCVGNKLMIAGGLQTKDTLDTSTNAGAYTESIVEFADLFIPGLIETFNNQTNLFGALNKKDHLMGGSEYGWKIKTDQASSLAVDPDDPTVVKNPVDKLKLRTAIKEYRTGVSVTDYVLHHARATMGDLLILEAEARMGDLMRDINDDLFTEQVDSGNQILGLEAVADSAGNTTLYGKTRSTANRLSPDSATDTYVAVGGALTTALIRDALEKVLVEGARRENLRIVVNPSQLTNLYELEDGNQNYFTAPKFGFEGQPSYDGVPIIVDSSCQTDGLFVIDTESYYIVVSRGPQMVGLAKVSAAEEAYVSMYLAAVYEQPRRIHMKDTLS